MDINFELYKVFYQVASTLSFSEASKKLFISQSAVSQSIKTLERKLGQPLFIRSTKKVQLSPAGQTLLMHVEPAINLLQKGETRLLDSNVLGLGQLHIGASDTICRYFLVPYLKQFHEQFPEVPIKVTNATSPRCVDLLAKGMIDLIITNYPNFRMSEAYVQKIVAHFQDVFIANPACLDLQQEEFSLADLNHYPILLLERQSTTSHFLHSLFLQHQLELIPAVELSSNDFLMDLARIGLGIAFVPDYCLSAEDELCVLTIKEMIPKRQMAAAINPDLPLSPAAQEFLKLLPEIS